MSSKLHEFNAVKLYTFTILIRVFVYKFTLCCIFKHNFMHCYIRLHKYAIFLSISPLFGILYFFERFHILCRCSQFFLNA